jgi:hypothetical protein
VLEETNNPVFAMKFLSFSSPSGRRWAVILLLAAVAGGSVATAQRSRVSVSFGVNVPLGGREFQHGRDRYYAYRGEYYRWDRGGYARCPPPRGYYIDRLPPHYERIGIGSDVYYRAGHEYYRPLGARYEIVEVPVVVERSVPAPRTSSAVSRVSTSNDLTAVWLNDQRYLLDNGQYFKMGSQGKVWVPTPVGAMIKSLPIGAMTVWHEENEYFEFAGGYFRRSPDGFKVVEAPWAKSVEIGAERPAAS